MNEKIKTSRELTTQDFYEMEKRDEAQILAEILGEPVKEMVYQYPRGSTKVTGISWVGIKEIARRYGKIDTEFVDFKDIGDAYMIVVKAIDIEKGTGLLGTSTQKKLMKSRGEMVPDKFAIQKAMSKAQRNAIKSLIPEVYFQKIFAELLKEHRTKKPVQSEQAPPMRRPAPVQRSPPVEPIQPDEEEQRSIITNPLADLTYDTIKETGISMSCIQFWENKEGIVVDLTREINDLWYTKINEKLMAEPLNGEYIGKGQYGFGSWQVPTPSH